MKKTFLFFLACLLTIAGYAQPGSLDATFNIGTGVNSQVYALSVQSDGKIIAGGIFTSFNGTACNRIARLNTDGSLDTGFNLGSGFNNVIYALSAQPNGKILVVGNFTSFNGTTCNRIARLNADGSLDAGFNIGIGTGFDNDVRAFAVQSDGKIIVGGSFTSFNPPGPSRNRIVRLNTDGSLDASFNTGTGFSGGFVNALYIQSDGKIVVGGEFTSYNGTACNYINRLNPDGSLDAGFNFNIGTGFNNQVIAFAVQSDGKIIVGGRFTSFNPPGPPRNRIVRLNTDGSLDAGFNTGTGFSSDVLALAVQSDGKILVGGQFGDFNGVSQLVIARLNTNGSLDTGFASVLGNSVRALVLQLDGKVLVGGDFNNFNGNPNRIARLIGNTPIATSVFVSPSGNDANDGLTSGTAKATIGAGLTLVDEGGTVRIAAGTYNETVAVTKNVTFIPSDPVNVQNLTMNGAGKTLTLSAALRVSQVVALQAGNITTNGSLILSSSATGTALIDNFTSGYTGTITGNIQARVYVANANPGYRYFGSPVTGATTSFFGFNTFNYNESIVTTNMNNGWQAYTGALNPLAGYNVFQTTAGNETYTLTGTANTGTYDRNITRQVANGTLNPSAGFNALGNPYPSPISWSALNTLNSGVTTGTAWLFKTTALYAGQWASINSAGVGVNGATNMIASSQGFMVRKATAGTSNFTINNSVRSNVFANNGNYLRPQDYPLVRLKITNGEYADELVVYAQNGASDKFDIGFDTEKFGGASDRPYITTQSENQNVCIYATDNLERKLELPLTVRTNGNYYFEMSEKNKITEKVYLLDKLTSTLHDLSTPYSFTFTGTQSNRFVLVLGNDAQSTTLQQSPIQIWSSEKVVYTRFKDLSLAQSSQMDILNIDGKSVANDIKINALEQKHTLEVPTGIYIVRVRNAEGTTTQKIIIQ
ncbi:MAG: T9SS C-terminal target domain-containing protein [Cytophagales bacterium]|nr:MAG: T9SS C-terminal target domain-containing protein [Cytophagales bacterium]